MATEAKMKPALSADEWADYLTAYGHATPEDPPDRYAHMTSAGRSGRDGNFHGAAAIALHGQPFGFTREDVERIRACNGMGPARFDLADRIEALLPPEE